MTIKTTINMKIGHCDLLEMAVRITGQSRRAIISMIMVRLAEDHDKFHCEWKRIRYQARGPRGHYRRLHLSLNENDYELHLDLKKFCKQSVSRLIACSIDLYLDELINNLNCKTIDFPAIRYSMNKSIINGSICWFLQWGLPVKPSRFKNYST